ncbi:MAG: isocitrate lyase/PEP mutase family protein [Iamia sp.]
MTDGGELADRFRRLHRPHVPLLVANPWDAGTAKLFASLGFSALATTSAGHAFSLGRADYHVTRDEALAHAAAIVSSVSVPVTADLENGFRHDAAGVAETVSGARAAGLAGCSIEDHTGNPEGPIYSAAHAVERIAAAAEAAHSGPTALVLTARAENHLHGRADLEDTIERLVAFAAAGADVVYAPGVTSAKDIAAIVGAVSVPVNVLMLPGGPTVSELADLGVGRVSVGSAFALVASDAAATAAKEFLIDGTARFWDNAARGMAVSARALSSARDR